MENKNEWRKVKLEDIVKIKGGKRLPKEVTLQKNKNKHPYIRIKDMISLKKLEINSSFEYVPDYVFEKIKNYIVNENDIILSIVGTIGLVNKIGNSLNGANLTENCVKITTKENVEYDYLYYFLISQKGKIEIEKGIVGAVQPKLPIKNIENIEVKLPSLNIQKKIVKILSDIDNKIELNNKINDNLETLCQNYFLDIFIKNSNKNCLIGTISDLGDIVGGSTPSKKNSNYYTNLGIPWITPKDLSKTPNKFISRGDLDITELGFKNSSVKLLPKGSVLFSSRAPIGYIAICTNNVTTNQGFKSIIPFKNIGTEFVYYFLKNNIQFLENRASGSTFKELSTAIMATTPAIIPKEEALKTFKEICNPIFKRQYIIEKENEKLTNLKNYLLPKLMNGEIDVENIKL